MALFGSIFMHYDVAALGTLEDIGVILAGAFIVFLVWQAAVVFDDIYDRGQTFSPSYLTFGTATAVIVLLAAIPMGVIPWLLTLLAVYLAIDYPRIRRKHFLLSGLIIGISSSAAFLFGAALPITANMTSLEMGAFVALAILLIFSGASLLKDIASIEADARSGISTIFTRLRANVALSVVATFVAIGFAFPALFLGALLDRALVLAVSVGVWFLILLTREKSYRPVLALYFVVGIWAFFRVFFVSP